MAEGILFGIAQEVLTNLGSTSLQEIALAWGFKDRLEKLKSTIITIKDVLLDAEERRVDSHAVRGWLERLATAVYAADDLFDEVATIASRKQLMYGKKWSRGVRTFFSSSNQVMFAFSISHKIKTIREKLDDLVKDSAEFTFLNRSLMEGTVINNRRGRDQTHSYVDAEEVIGREDDKKAILDVLLSSNKTKNKVNPDVITIVGIGGQGKTTLAQLVYNEPLVDKYFQLKLWVCVSEVFDIKVISEKILKSATITQNQNLEMDQIQLLLRNQLREKKYLLVLDDVWNENREEWLTLSALLKFGRMGSKILVTTRSKEVANVMDSVLLYELQGLIEDKSWELFQKMAFTHDQLQQKPDHMMNVGKEIVKKCANVPLAIRVVGSLLYGKDERKWSSLKTRSLANILDGQNGVMDILELSYQHLPSPLKNCFAYCALYSKDYEFNKQTLIDLWLAEGFIIPLNYEVQDLEEIGEDYFLFLLQRCFFQDVKFNKLGNIISCKMHDLVHDLAQQMAGVKCKVAKTEDSSSNKDIQHLSFGYRLTSLWEVPSWMLNLKLLRTFLLPEQNSDGSLFTKSVCQELISRFRCLRVLDLHDIELENLPSSIGKLIHLRYLDLSNNTAIKEVPASIVKLDNLQTLVLSGCRNLQTLPKDMRKFTKLRSLNVDQCYKIKHMPSGLGELTSLTKLPRFIVNTKQFPFSAKLSDLNSLNLRGDLCIEIMGKLDFENPLLEAQLANLDKKEGLTKLHIQLNVNHIEGLAVLHTDLNNDSRFYQGDTDISNVEAVLEGLKPHSKLKHLEIHYYNGRKLPSWAMNNLCESLPNLVEIRFLHCDWCQHIPSFGQLPFLKSLSLVFLGSVEYMEIGGGSDEPSSSPKPSFFPSLEELNLAFMENLKGWWKTGTTRNDDTKASEESHQLTEGLLLSLSFSKLKKLILYECPKLIYLPHCPNLEESTLTNVNKRLSLSKITGSTASTSTSLGSSSKLKSLTVSNVKDLISFSRENNLHQISELDIQDVKMVSTEELLGSRLSSSLRTMRLSNCIRLRSMARGMEHLTAMENMVVWNCQQLDLSSNEQLPWKNLVSLRSLQFYYIPKLLSLPIGLRHLTNLHSLDISHNDEFKELPEWISCLSSLGCLKLFRCPRLTSLPDGIRNIATLNQLEIIGCPELTERCRAPNGMDWPKIQHIPFVSVRH